MPASRGAEAAHRQGQLLARRVTLVLLTVITAAAGVVLSAPVRTVAEARVTLAAYGQTSQIGALFAVTPSGQLGDHFCTASVVDSAAGDLVLTAAHCVRGFPVARIAFVPDYDGGQAPAGIWTVTRVIVDQGWLSSGDPADDFAFLIVSRPGSRPSVESVTGAEAIAVGVPPGGRVEVAGYPDAAGSLVSCENTAGIFSATQLMFRCAGFSDGTSGGPLLANVSPADGRETVIGVIGGYQRGGSTSSVSYAARFSGRLGALYQQALTAAGPR